MKEEHAYNLSSDHAFAKAKQKGWDVVVSDKYTLQVDIDSLEQLEIFENRLQLFKEYYECSVDIQESIVVVLIFMYM